MREEAIFEIDVGICALHGGGEGSKSKSVRRSQALTVCLFARHQFSYWRLDMCDVLFFNFATG